VPNGIDPLEYAGAAAIQTCHPAAASREPLTIVCPARLSYQKGQDVLLRAWQTVQACVPAARLVLAGDGPLRQELEDLALDLGVAATVDFAGLVADMPALLAGASGFVLPSRYEGMSNALLEAMAAGQPCVATRVSGSEDVIVDGQSGLLVPSEDPEALASALVTVLADRARAHALGREARARVVAAFDSRHVMNALSQLYTSLGRTSAAQRPEGDLAASRRARLAP
jgi:glycosyltransferase involved in cell wall biosynthesis